MRVISVPSDRNAPGYYRLALPAMTLEDQGEDIEFTFAEGLPMVDAHGKLAIPRVTEPVALHPEVECDVLILQRPMVPYQLLALESAQRRGIRVVVEVDDDLHATDKRSQFGAQTTADHLRVFEQCCAKADLVTVSTPALARKYGDHGRVVVLPNYVPKAWTTIGVYPNIEPVDAVRHPRRIGWTGSIGNHIADLEAARGGAGNAITEEAGAAFRCYGRGNQKSRDHICRVMRVSDVEILPWQPMDRYPHEIAKLDVGIAPLANTTFNRSKCLDAYTRVMTDTGIRPIGQVSESDRVWHGDKWRVVEAVERGRAMKGYEIETALGLRLKLTPNHRLSADGEWKRADALAVGDALELDGEQWPQAVPYAQVPWPAESRMSRRRAADPQAFIHAKSGPRLTIDERWGRILGLYAGDGCAANGQVRFALDGQDADLIDALIADIGAVGLHGSTEARTTWAGEAIRRRSVTMSSTALARVFEYIGVLERTVAGGTRRVVRVPDLIWTSPRSVVAQFLAALFEADGHVDRGHGIGFCTKEEQFARDVQRLLVGFGIFSRISARPANGRYADRYYWYVTLRRASADVFAREIGFLSRRKRALLDVVIARPHSNAYRPMPTQDAIVSITPAIVAPVDLQVEGSVFAAAGIVSHNSWLKPLEYAACGVPCVMSPTDEYRRLHDEHGIGVLADHLSPAAWKRGVGRLLSDPGYRAEKGERDREAVRESLTIEKNAHRWAEAWSSALVAA